jgi:hypothetical protein
MTKLFQKVLSILCVIALLVSGIAIAFADEANEAPVMDEAAQLTADYEAAQIAAEEAEAARIAAEEAEAARIAAEQEAEAARIAAEEAEAARKAAEEAEAARIAVEEEAARKAAEEAEAARIAAEEEAARKAAEEAEAARIAAEEEAARKAAEEAEAARIAAEEEAAKQDEEVIEEDETDENGFVEIDDGWGYVDPDVISENTPEITDELKGIRTASMNVNEMLTDSLTFGEELVITLKCRNARNVELKLYTAGSDISVKLDGKAVAFYADNSDDPAYAMSTFVLENTAGQSHKIALSTNDAVSFKLAAVAEQTEVQEVTPGTEVSDLIETNNNEETTPSEEINNEVIPETNENNSENAENPETDINVEPIENNNDNNNEAIIEPIVPAEPAEPTIQVSMKTYSALKVGSSISDNLLGGQKAKFQVKCGKNDNVKLILNANPDDLNIKIDGTDAGFVQDAEGTYSIELNDVAFRKFTIILSAKQDLAFALSAESAGAAAVEEEENEEDINEEDINKEETETTDEAAAEETTEEVTEETAEGENTEETEKTEEENTEDAETSEEETEGTEEEAVEENTDEENEKMTALGCTKVTVTAEEGADLYAEASKASEVVGHLDAGTEAWITMTEDQAFGQIYSEDEEAAAQFISMEDAEVKVDIETALADEEDIEVTTAMTETSEIELTVTSTLASHDVAYGETCTEYADLSAVPEEEYSDITIKWYYSPDGANTWLEVEDAEGSEYSFTLGSSNWYYQWKAMAIVTIQKEIETLEEKTNVENESSSDNNETISTQEKTPEQVSTEEPIEIPEE